MGGKYSYRKKVEILVYMVVFVSLQYLSLVYLFVIFFCRSLHLISLPTPWEISVFQRKLMIFALSVPILFF